MKLFRLVFLLALVLALPFLLWGNYFESTFTQEGTLAWLADMQQWAWLAALGMLTADLILPLPATVIMAALGILYGPWVGGLVGALGSFLAGSVAYLLCRRFGRPAALKLAGTADMARGERLFARAGGFLVAASRWMPILPEVIACLAGLTRMPSARFFSALASGALPLGLTFAYIGHAGADRPILTLAISALAPVVLWLAVRPLLRSSRHQVAASEERRADL